MIMMNPMCAEKANNRPPNIPGCPGIQSDVRGNPDVALDHLECTNFGQFFVILPTSKPCGATLKPRRSQNFWSKCHSIFKRSTRNFTEVGNEHPTSRTGSVEKSRLFGACEVHDFWSAVTIPHPSLRATFEKWKELPAHA